MAAASAFGVHTSIAQVFVSTDGGKGLHGGGRHFRDRSRKDGRSLYLRARPRVGRPKRPLQAESLPHLTTRAHYTIVYSITRLIWEISPGQFRALSEFRHQIRKFLHFSERAARAHGLAPQQHQLLLAIKGFDGSSHGPTIGYLAERLQVRHHSAVELVNRMVTHGMVQRQTGEHDRRLVTVAMSETGERILKDLAAEHIAEIQQTGPRLVAALQQVIESDQIPEPANLNTPKDSGLPS